MKNLLSILCLLAAFAGELRAQSYSIPWFTIDGDDYKPYAELREKVLKEMLNVGGMPPSQKTDVQLQAEMMKLLRKITSCQNFPLSDSPMLVNHLC